jgi:adenylate cyclase
MDEVILVKGKIDMSKGEDVQQRNKQGQDYHTESEKRVNSIENGSGIEYTQQYQTILNLYNSGIPTYIIAFQLDMNEDDVRKIIQSTSNNTKPLLASPFSMSLLENNFDSSTLSLDNSVNMDIAIRNAQVRMWKALRSEPEISLSMERTNEVLRAFAKSKVTLVTLNIDLVESTELSISLPLERLSTILQTFMQEVASLITSYGGYVLKYIGDAVLGFFIVPNKGQSENSIVEYSNNKSDDQVNCIYKKVSSNSSYVPCINTINCARSIIKILDQAINPILNQYDYPEMSVRIAIDIGENVVIQDGWDIHKLQQSNNQEIANTVIVREPHYDIIGYSTNIAVKMTELANTNGIVIGQSVYDTLAHEKSSFKLLKVNPDVWKYIDERTDTVYLVYHSS